MEAKRMFIGGEWVDAASGATRESVDPATNEAFATVPDASADDVDRAVAAAREAFQGDWGTTSATDRGKLLHRVAEAIRERLDAIVRTEVRDNGKPYREARGDILFAADAFDYYAGAADKIQGATIPVPGNRLNYTLRQPLGVTAHIVPWNYPFELASRSIAPALAAGNTVVAKPAEDTCLSILHLAEILEGLEAPAGAFNVVTGDGPNVGAPLAGHPDVDGVTLTGSVETGAKVMEAAAANITPVTLELGGKGPNIVFPDADLEAASKGVAFGIFMNAGQMCWAGSRLLVHEDLHDELVKRLQGLAESYWTLGPGLEKETRMGPLVSPAQRERVLGYVEKGEDEGAKLVTGGEVPTADPLQRGNFLEPTIFSGVDRDMTIAREEIFGPVLSVLTFHDEDEALDIANDVEYGLYGGLWTSNLARAHRMARDLEVGIVSVNEYPVTFPQTPFPGWKKSGLGVEQGLEALNNYLRTKNVNVSLR